MGIPDLRGIEIAEEGTIDSEIGALYHRESGGGVNVYPNPQLLGEVEEKDDIEIMAVVKLKSAPPLPLPLPFQ